MKLVSNDILTDLYEETFIQVSASVEKDSTFGKSLANIMNPIQIATMQVRMQVETEPL